MHADVQDVFFCATRYHKHEEAMTLLHVTELISSNYAAILW